MDRRITGWDENAGGGVEPLAPDLLLFDEVERDTFRARHNLDNHMGAAFGGQLLGQALAAASATADGRLASSLNGYFFRPGGIADPIDYRVERISDGRRFTARQVTALQRGRPIFGVQCAFHDGMGEGVEHQAPMPGDLPDPDGLMSLAQLAQARPELLPDGLLSSIRRGFPVELRPLHPETFLAEEDRAFWFRMPSAAPVEGAAAHQALVAVMSDYWLPAAIVTRHSDLSLRYAVMSLNHSMWFHDSARADEWLLYKTDSHWARQGRGLARGLIYARDGRLVATAMQEALLQAL